MYFIGIVVCALLAYYIFYAATNKLANILATISTSAGNGKRTKGKGSSKDNPKSNSKAAQEATKRTTNLKRRRTPPPMTMV
jgi:hypothetical protein